jgi:WD40 repeat protein
MINGIRINTYRVPEKGTLCTFSEKGKLFAYTGADGKVALINTDTGKEVRSYPGVMSTLQTIELNRDGTRLLLAQWKTVKLIDTSTWKEIISINTTNNRLAKLSTDGRLIASASGSPDYNITIFNTADGKTKNVLKGHSNRIHTLDFSPDGKRLISGSGEDHKDNSLRVWDLESGNQISTLAKKGGFIYSAALSPDGKKIAAVSTFRKVMLFDASGGSTITEFEVKGANLTKISFSVDGRRLLIGSSEGVIRIYDIETDAVIAASAFTKGNEYVLASTDGRYDATKGGVDKLHWVSGNEVIMLGDFDKDFIKKVYYHSSQATTQKSKKKPLTLLTFKAADR